GQSLTHCQTFLWSGEQVHRHCTGQRNRQPRPHPGGTGVVFARALVGILSSDKNAGAVMFGWLPHSCFCCWKTGHPAWLLTQATRLSARPPKQCLLSQLLSYPRE